MKISLVMSACNQGRFLAETIACARRTCSESLEVVVVDDQSTDGCCANLGDNVNIIRPGCKLGCSGGRALAAAHATGDVIIITDPHCFYQTGALESIGEWSLDESPSIVQPVVHWENKGTTKGGLIRKTRYGISILRTFKRQDQFPGLFGGIYAMSHETLELLDGLPVLPGWWGRWEQLVTTMAYYLGIPIRVDQRFICTHRAYRKSGQYPYPIPGAHNVWNSHWFHAACFPRTYEEIWKPLMIKAWGDCEDYKIDLRSDKFLRFRDWLHNNKVIGEYKFLVHVARCSVSLLSTEVY